MLWQITQSWSCGPARPPRNGTSWNSGCHIGSINQRRLLPAPNPPALWSAPLETNTCIDLSFHLVFFKRLSRFVSRLQQLRRPSRLVHGRKNTRELPSSSTARYLRILLNREEAILWPIIGPAGKPMTRAWPMDEADAVTKDHPHHRSLWFSHGDVDGSDLWAEGKGTGSTEHREFVEVAGGKKAKIVTKNDWLDKAGKKLAEDERTLTFSTDGDSRIIDFDIVIKATEGELKLGDTKEGTFAVRVPDDFRVTAKKGGRIINSEGISDKETWGKPAAWVDYEGPIDGEIMGIAILNHPSSYGFPTHWHVCDYGLFAANPFGLHDFNGGNGEKGTLIVKPGETIKLGYRVIFHKGDEKKARIAEAFSEYSEVNKPKTVPITGKVLIDGQPLKVGTVIFTPENGRQAMGKVDQDGNFTLTTFMQGDGALVGKSHVAISGAEYVGKNKTRWHLPKKYADIQTSGLVVAISEPTKELVISLTWDGGKPFVEVESETTAK